MEWKEKQEKTAQRAFELIRSVLNRVKEQSPSVHQQIESMFHGFSKNSSEEHLRLVVTLLEFTDPKLSPDDRFALSFQALQLYSALCKSPDAEMILNALTQADDLYKRQQTEQALEVLNDTAQAYVL